MILHHAVVYNAYCESDSRTHLVARTREELFAKIYDGQREHIYGDIVEMWEEEGIDPDAGEAEQTRIRRIRLTSCQLPPVEDLQLLSEAKALPPERWEEIDPSRGSWKTTRQRLETIRNDKHNQAIRAFWLAQT